MKRVLQHIIFWLCYALLCMNMDYLWVSKVLPDMSTADLWKGMFLSGALGIIPEIVFAYYLMYRGFERLICERKIVWLNLAESILVLLICLAATRLLSHYTLLHLAYNGRLAEPETWDLPVLWRAGIYIGFSSGFALSLHLFRKQMKTAQREKMLVEANLNTELKLLQQQLHPHFLFNTLNNIYALARKKSDAAPDAVMKLSELLHFMLYQSEQAAIPLSREISFLEDYLALERIRYNDRLTLSFTKNISDENAPVAPLLLLPLVENAFKHGASETRFNSSINISLTQHKEAFHFTISNTYDPDQTKRQTGKLGLNNTRRRLSLLYKEQVLDIRNDDQHFYVDLYLNLNSHGKA